MRTRGCISLASLVLAVGLGSCGGGSSSTNTPPPPVIPTPTVTSVSPDHVSAGSSDTTLTVNGSNFASGSTVTFNGAAKTTTFVSASQLTAVLRAADLTQQGVFNVTVTTPGAPAASAAIQFRVGNGLPAITSFSPASITIGATSPVTVTVNGSNFFPDSSVLVDLAAHPTTFVSGSKLTFVLAPAELLAARQISVAVLNTGSGGGQSAPRSLTVGNPVPVLGSMTPSTTPAGTGVLHIAISGSGFLPNTQVLVDGQMVNSFVLDPSDITAVLDITVEPATLAPPGTSQVTVVNPAPGGGPSNALVFTRTKVTPGFNLVAADLDNIGQVVGGERISLSADGEYFAFDSRTGPLLGNGPNLYLRDLCTGVAGCTPETSPFIKGAGPVLSATARYMAFEDEKDFRTEPLGPRNQINVRLEDTCIGGPAGCISTTIPVSVSDTGVLSDTQNGFASMSPDGRFIAFQSFDSALTHDGFDPPPISNSFDSNVFRRDTCIGAVPPCTPTTIRISIPAAPRTTPVDSGSFNAAISDTGRFVAFSSTAPDLLATPADGPILQSYLRDTCTGAPSGCTPHTMSVGLAPSGAAYENSSVGGIDAAGRFVALIFGDTGLNKSGIAVRDTCIGAPTGCVPSTKEIVTAPGGGSFGTFPSFNLSTSANMRFIAFSSDVTTLVPEDTNGQTDAFIVDTCIGAAAGCTNRVVRLSVTASGIQAGGHARGISRDGRIVAISTTAETNLLKGLFGGINAVINNPLLP